MKCILMSSFLACVISCVTSRTVAQTTGMTFGNEVTFVTPPNLRLVSKDSINGRPSFDFFVLVRAKLNGIYDISGGLQGYETFNVGQIDVWGSDNTQRSSLDMHQSQIRVRGQRETGMGPFIGYAEGDFWGGSNHFRLRHAWVDFQFIHFGQDWSFFGDKDIWPSVLDWDGPPSGVWHRSTELKFYFDVLAKSRFEIGFSTPALAVAYNSDIDSTVSSASQRFPDVIAA